jgi:fatty acid desaturase
MKVTDVLTADQIREVTAKSDLRGAWMVACQFAITIGIFTVAAIWTNPITVVLGTVLLAGRQLGFGVLGHECGHRTLFRTRAFNDWVAHWLLDPPGFGNNAAYMRGHLQHHRLAGTATDPDLGNYRDYPITTERLKRKLTRDLTGRTGWRQLKGIGKGIRNFSALNDEQRASLVHGLAFNGLLAATLIVVGEGWLYLMWVVAYVFLLPAISRIRQVAEHAAVPDLYDLDPRNNTRTVLARPLERLVFAPHRVSYHLEHHLMASVSAYRLRRLHQLLQANGYYAEVEFPNGYPDLLRRVTAPAALATNA